MRHKWLTMAVVIALPTLVVYGGTAPEQLDYRAFALRLFPELDPNALVGAVLPAQPGIDPNDPNAWKAPIGPWVRTGGIYDAETLDYITIKGMAGSLPVIASVDPNAETWTIETNLTPGVHPIALCVDDDPPLMTFRRRQVTILVIVDQPPNTTPVVE